MFFEELFLGDIESRVIIEKQHLITGGTFATSSFSLVFFTSRCIGNLGYVLVTSKVKNSYSQDEIQKIEPQNK